MSGLDVIEGLVVVTALFFAVLRIPSLAAEGNRQAANWAAIASLWMVVSLLTLIRAAS